MSETPVENHPCDDCGQLDDHPMIHISGLWRRDERITVANPSFHFDCLPAEYVDLLGDDPQHAVTRAARDAALSGVHGAELRTFIASLPSDNDVVPQEG